ncbi:MAG: Gx transporter family protein [Anaerovoracaceae bacterium]
MNTTQSQNNSSAKYSPTQIASVALLTTLAMICSYLETFLPLPLAIPGIKLGIANLVIIIALYLLNVKAVFCINLLRILLSGFLFTGVFGILYSLAGGMLSLCLMVLLNKTSWFSILGISIAGGVAHNLGQLLTAAYLMGTFKVFYYFPVLLFSGLICGGIIGLLAYLILRKLPRGILPKNTNFIKERNIQ